MAGSGRLPIALTLPTALALGVACTTPATNPHDMSTAGHESAARDEERLASGEGVRCAEGSVCWTETSATRDDADEHRSLAARHRAAASALALAEERACVGLDETSRDESPFAHRADIASVEELTEDVPRGRAVVRRTAGATIVFRAVPGMTAEWLQRVVDCHVARNAALGHDVPEMPYCPLVPRDVAALVRSVRGGFAVDVRSDDDASAVEVLRRARALIAPVAAR